MKNTINTIWSGNVFNSQQEEYSRNVPYECTESLLELLHGIFSTQVTSRRVCVRVVNVLKDICFFLCLYMFIKAELYASHKT
jgi:hypothetical protein